VEQFNCVGMGYFQTYCFTHIYFFVVVEKWATEACS